MKLGVWLIHINEISLFAVCTNPLLGSLLKYIFIVCLVEWDIIPFVSIGRYLTSKGKVMVRDICLNISFLT